MPATELAAAHDEARGRQRSQGIVSGFRPPRLPPASRRAFRYHMAYSLLDAISAGILSNAPVMAVKAMQATDAQLQIPIAMTSLGLFASVVMGVVMALRRKKPFVVVPGILSALSAGAMAWTTSAGWFLSAFGMISVFDFSLRPAVPSILRSVYPDHCRSHVAGTLRQYASIVFPASSLLFASLLAWASNHVQPMIHFQLMLACCSTLAAFICFAQIPDRGDGSMEEASPTRNASVRSVSWESLRAGIVPLRDPRFRRFLIIYFIYASGNLFYMGTVAPFFARDLKLGYVQATLLIHIVPAVAGFLAGGRLTAWFDRTSIWRSYAVVMLLWGLDPVLLAIAPSVFAVLMLARVLRGPATVGGMVLTVYTGVHRFVRPGPHTSCYTSALFFVNGIARFASPVAAAMLSGYWSHRTILFSGGVAVLLASALFLYMDRQEGTPREDFGSFSPTQ